MPVISFISAEDYIVAVVGFTVVFSVMLLLALVFTNLPKIMQYFQRMQLKKDGKIDTSKPINYNVEADISAAISTALYLYFSELHDEESAVLTIKKISKRYSPWSSKIYSTQNYPVKK